MTAKGGRPWEGRPTGRSMSLEQNRHCVPSLETLLCSDQPWELIRCPVSVSTPVKWAPGTGMDWTLPDTAPQAGAVRTVTTQSRRGRRRWRGGVHAPHTNTHTSVQLSCPYSAMCSLTPEKAADIPTSCPHPPSCLAPMPSSSMPATAPHPQNPGSGLRQKDPSTAALPGPCRREEAG